MQRIVRMDVVPAARRPALPMRVGVAWVRVAFALLIGACHYIVAGSFD
ncbi:hypothetical protein [Paraburkholderia sp. RAU2J]|nr:hypothetical protein [Paraburkholderia sp. RAU2J]